MNKFSCLAATAVIAFSGLMAVIPEADARGAFIGPRGGGAFAGPRGGAVWGPRGGAVFSNPGHYYGGGRYYGPVRPGGGVTVINPRPYWSPGGAFAAGAALGYVSGVVASNLAGAPPQPGYCWFYTNPQRTTGFWEPCP